MADETTESTVKKTVSLPQELALAAAKKAQAEQRNFSSYIQFLIARDLKSPEPVAVGGE